MAEIICPKDHEVDLSLIDTVALETGLFLATLECRQCGTIFELELTASEVDEF